MLIRTDIPLGEEIDQLGPKRRGTPERDFQRWAIKYMRQILPPGSIVAAIVNEQRGAGKTDAQRMRYGQARKASGVVSGFFDAAALLPMGMTLWIEFKSPTGVISEAQGRIHDQARMLGHKVVIANSPETLRWGLNAAGIQTREAPDASVAAPKVRRAKSKIAADGVPF